MSKMRKMQNKRKHYIKRAKLVGNKVESTGSKGPARTKRLHTKQGKLHGYTRAAH